MIGSFATGENAVTDEASSHAADNHKDLSYEFDLHLLH
jgi:hypothetical protein